MKRHHTDNFVRMTIVGPSEKMDEAVEALKAYGFERSLADDPDMVNWHDVKEDLGLDRPGVHLQGARIREDLSVEELAVRSGISVEDIQAMEAGELEIDPVTARRLGAILNIEANYLIN